MTYWRLPKGVDEVLPPRAWQLEQLRRRVLDVFDRWGYDYLEPPVIEYLDALLVGSGEDLDLQTLKVIDQDSGRQLGVRADMTSQAVRVDAHSLRSDNVQRYCYAGPVVFAKPQGDQTSRVPLKAGAEIFGASGIAADAEVIGLMLEGLKVANMPKASVAPKTMTLSASTSIRSMAGYSSRRTVACSRPRLKARSCRPTFMRLAPA